MEKGGNGTAVMGEERERRLVRCSALPSPGPLIDSLLSTSEIAGWTVPCILLCPNLSGFAGAVLVMIGRLYRTPSTTAGAAVFNCEDWM